MHFALDKYSFEIQNNTIYLYNYTIDKIKTNISRTYKTKLLLIIIIYLFITIVNAQQQCAKQFGNIEYYL